MLVDPIINQGFVESFFDEEGNLERQIVTGRFVNELTNLDSGESITVNISGPAVFTTRGNLTVEPVEPFYFLPEI